jgi:hypothetical protein
MVSRGYTGTLPITTRGRLGPADILFIVMAALSAFAIALY